MIKVITPTGFCNGVKNAVAKAQQTKKDHPKAVVYLLRPIVHNQETSQALMKEAEIALFDPSLPSKNYLDSYFLMPAHGFTKRDGLLVHYLRSTAVDCTCPFLLAYKSAMKKDLAKGRLVYYIGKEGHAETLSVLDMDSRIIFIPEAQLSAFDISQWDEKDHISVYPQSTFSYDEYEDFQISFHNRFHSFKDIVFSPLCHECLVRWEKINALNESPDCSFVVVSDPSSSNGTEFVKYIKKRYPEAHIIMAANVKELTNQMDKLNYRLNIYVCSATSSSQEEVDSIVDTLRKRNRKHVLPFWPQKK